MKGFVSLAAALQGPFFGWFHLSEMPSSAQSPSEWRRFRPSGESFHSLVELALLTHGEDDICAGLLGIDGEFIRNPRQSPFARDLAASFLRFILPLKSAEALAVQIAILKAPEAGEGPVITRRTMPTRSDDATAMLFADAFANRTPRAEINAAGAQIAFMTLPGNLPKDISAFAHLDTCSSKPDPDNAWLSIRVNLAPV